MHRPRSAPSFSRFARGLALAAGLSLLAACSTSPMSRIDSNRQVYESWPIDVQEAVMNGKAIPGMTPEQVKVALGEPTSTDSRPVADGTEEIWTYRKSSGSSLPGLLEHTGLSVGAGTGGVGVGVGGNVPLGGGGNRGGAPADEDEVVFKNGVVIRGT